MPYSVRYKPVKGRDAPWAIINKDTGHIVGRSRTKALANGSIRARLAAERRR